LLGPELLSGQKQFSQKANKRRIQYHYGKGMNIPYLTRGKILFIISVFIWLIPGIVYWTIYYCPYPLHHGSGGPVPEILGIIFLAMLLLILIGLSSVFPFLLLIWGPVNMKVFLIVYFVLSYGLLIVFYRRKKRGKTEKVLADFILTNSD
jgi:hypothetical protein